jgi:hypothetical protein
MKPLWQGNMKTVALLTLVILFLTGCTAGRTSPISLQAETGVRPGAPVIAVPHKTLVPAHEIPLHVRKVTETLARIITGHPEKETHVSFAHAQAAPQPVEWLQSQDFRVQDIEMSCLGKDETSELPDHNTLELIMRFSDRLQRSASLMIRASYEAGPKGLVVTSSRVLELDPYFPETQAFLVEDHVFEKMDRADSSFAEFYESVVSSAVSLTPTDEDRRTRLGLDSMSVYERLAIMPNDKRRDYRVVVFVMDRLSPDAGLEIIASGSPFGHSWIDHVNYHDFDGWRTGVFPLNFALDWEIYYISTLYTPGRPYFPKTGERIRTGLFVTERNYLDWPAFDRETAAQGPLARCGFLLNPQDPRDARTIQARLKELGLAGEIEDQWGPRQEHALKIFQQQKNILPTGNWNQDTQKELFWNSGM